MKRILLVAAMFAAGPSFAQSEYLQGDALKAEVERLCEHGCIVFSPAEVEALQKAILEKMLADQVQAYEQGKKLGALSCRNAISFTQ